MDGAWYRPERPYPDRLRFETLLSELSATFVNLPSADVDRRIEGALRLILAELDLDRASLAEASPDLRTGVVTHSVTAEGVAPPPVSFSADRFPWSAARLAQGAIIEFARLEDLPAEAATDREAYRALGARSVVVIPLAVGGVVVGALSFITVRAEREWAGEIVPRLRLVGEIFANALARRRVETALRESEARFRLLAEAAPVMIWMSDHDDRCTYVNARWVAFTGRSFDDAQGEGRAAPVHPDERVRLREQVAHAVEARQPYAHEYRMLRADGEYRYVLDHGVPRFGVDGAFLGYIGSTVDVTDVKLAHQQRDELAHALRVTTMGELAGALAHEIIQPLTAILANAETAQLAIDTGRLQPRTMQAVMADIAADARRAVQVIQRLRALFGKHPVDHKPVNVNTLITDVLSLLRRDLEEARITARLVLDDDLPVVMGDAVQLQQVVLNLALNACESMASLAEGPRELTIETRRSDAGGATIIVRDTGPGVHPDDLERIFEPFVSTKAAGLGMGLSISRSIIRAHHGHIRAVAGEGRGLSVHVELPGSCTSPRS